MSTETDKRCGTCKWFSSMGDQAIGDCAVNLPNSLVDPYQEMMTPHEGADCPCWEPKQCAEIESYSDFTKRLLTKIAEDKGLTYEQLTEKLIQPLELIIDSPEGRRLVATYELSMKK